MSKIRFVGDIHGNVHVLDSIIKEIDHPSIQVGDFGIGFINLLSDEIFTKEDKVSYIRGNHDDPTECKLDSNYIPDGTIKTIDGLKFMFIGGAKSIDRHMRIEGVSWWRDEELSYDEFDQIIQKYNDEKPDVMITHECPDVIAEQICLYRNKTKFNDRSITREALDVMFLNHKPELHIFGHWHVDFDRNILGTRFICLNEFSFIDIDTNDLMDSEIVSYY